MYVCMDVCYLHIYRLTALSTSLYKLYTAILVQHDYNTMEPLNNSLHQYPETEPVTKPNK